MQCNAYSRCATLLSDVNNNGTSYNIYNDNPAIDSMNFIAFFCTFASLQGYSTSNKQTNIWLNLWCRLCHGIHVEKPAHTHTQRANSINTATAIHSQSLALLISTRESIPNQHDMNIVKVNRNRNKQMNIIYIHKPTHKCSMLGGGGGSSSVGIKSAIYQPIDSPEFDNALLLNYIVVKCAFIYYCTLYHFAS